MVEICGVPTRGSVAGGAGGGRKTCLQMRRIVRAVVLLHVARSAIRRGSHELAIDVALQTRNAYMLADQREIRGLVVIEGGVEPTGRVVAGGAHPRDKTRLRVRRIIGGGVILRMATVAICGSPLEFAADVAGRTVQGCVHPGQSKAGEFQVIEFRPEPCIGTVTGLARRGKSQGSVIGSDRLLEIGGVTGQAGCRYTRELPRGLPLVAIGTFQHGVGAQEREAVLMLLELLRVDFPALLGVTLLAPGPELAPVDVRVTFRAASTGILEFQAGMALRAADFLVHSAQGIACSVVVKFGDAADWLPTRICVAVFARDGDRAVGIFRVFLFRLGVNKVFPYHQGNQQPEQQRE